MGYNTLKPTILESATISHSNLSLVHCPTVELWDFSLQNLNKETQKATVGLVASISYGNFNPREPERLYDKLLKLGHESPLEFVRDVEKEEVLEVDGVYVVPSGIGIDKSLRNRKISLYPTTKNTKILLDNLATFKLRVPIYSARQIMRHRAFSYLELSRRYTKDNKIPFETYIPESIAKKPLLRTIFKFHFWLFKKIYNYFLSQGIKPEDARALMPVSTMTEFWMMGDYKGFLNFFVERIQPEAQGITRKVAKTMLSLLIKHQPNFVDNMISYIPEYVKHHIPEISKARKRKCDVLINIVKKNT